MNEKIKKNFRIRKHAGLYYVERRYEFYYKKSFSFLSIEIEYGKPELGHKWKYVNYEGEFYGRFDSKYKAFQTQKEAEEFICIVCEPDEIITFDK